MDQYRFCCVPFSIVSSPLGATVESHLEKSENNLASKQNDYIYVYNVIKRTNSIESVVHGATSIFREASMGLK